MPINSFSVCNYKMSLARQFFREMRPLFRMLEEPLPRSHAYGGFPRSLLDDSFFRTSSVLQPPVDVSEEGNNYVIEAELPGVKKENVEVRIGDGGRSVTIEGKVISRRSEPPENSAVAGSEGVVEPAAEGMLYDSNF